VVGNNAKWCQSWGLPEPQDYRLSNLLAAKMNIKFSWKRDADGFHPVSESNLLNQDGFSLLDCVLMDSGGLPYLETVPWLNEGIKRIKSVTTGELESSDWSRETWGVEFRNNKAKIYSLHDEQYFSDSRP
jgi:hypothetical protein